MSKRVDFPQPEGPNKVTKSPSFTSRSAGPNAKIGWPSVLNDLETFLMLIAASIDCRNKNRKE
jgi:hypothetical protein